VTLDRITRARALRKASPNPEAVLWRALRHRQLVGWKFRRQHPVGGYVADFVTVAGRLILEVDGESHFIGSGLARDTLRTATLEKLGWRIFRVTNADVRDNLDGVWQALAETLGPAPVTAPRQPSPPSPGTLRVPTSPPAARTGEVSGGDMPLARVPR
jgi:very-short-patch-repair endonuclease